MGTKKRKVSAHDFCRLLLKTTMESLKKPDPVRFVKTEINGKVKLGSASTYWGDITDHRDPQTGTRWPSEGAPGHFRKVTYEVDGCCAASAKVAALDRHERDFNPSEAAPLRKLQAFGDPKPAPVVNVAPGVRA